jgi:hypothetical protein
MQCRMLPMLLESFVGTFVYIQHVSRARTTISEDMRRHQHLITNDVIRYMAEYEVRRLFYASPILVRHSWTSTLQASGDPDVISQLVLLLADWYFAWAPGGE